MATSAGSRRPARLRDRSGADRDGIWDRPRHRCGLVTPGSGTVNPLRRDLVYRASDRTPLLVVRNESPSQATWETDSRVLLRTHLPESSPSTYQLVRCTLSGSCSCAGPRTTAVDGAIIPATRRNR